MRVAEKVFQMSSPHCRQAVPAQRGSAVHGPLPGLHLERAASQTDGQGGDAGQTRPGQGIAKTKLNIK